MAEVQPGLFRVASDERTSTADQIAHLHPANCHLIGKPIPQLQLVAIDDAIARDGQDAVFRGTSNLAEGVAQWEPSDLRFIPNPIKFYQESGYLKNPETWKRIRKKNSSEQCTTHPQAGFTDWGECWGCYGNKYVSGCQPA